MGEETKSHPTLYDLSTFEITTFYQPHQRNQPDLLSHAFGQSQSASDETAAGQGMS